MIGWNSAVLQKILKCCGKYARDTDRDTERETLSYLSQIYTAQIIYLHNTKSVTTVRIKTTLDSGGSRISCRGANPRRGEMQ